MMETVTDFNFRGFKITADGDCSHGGSEKSGKLEVGGASRHSTGFGALKGGLITS